MFLRLSWFYGVGRLLKVHVLIFGLEFVERWVCEMLLFFVPLVLGEGSVVFECVMNRREWSKCQSFFWDHEYSSPQ